MKRIAVFGGSFNPFHNGHAAMVFSAYNQLSVDEVWLMPAKQPPHKPSYGNISDEDRVLMLKAFAESYSYIKVSDYELNQEGFTYTANTLRELKVLFPEYIFYFLIGGDSLAGFENWYHPEEIVKYADIAVCTRKDCDRKVLTDTIEKLKSSVGGNYLILDFENINVSSSEVREKLSNGLDVSELIPLRVWEYIKAHGLYMEENSVYTLEELIHKMKEVLPPKRFKHVLGVKDTAVMLAEKFGCDSDKAAIAGLLHDCAKTLSAEQLINLCRQNKVDFSDDEIIDELTTKSLLHSKAGSVLARNLYYIRDEEILSAIFYHTVGKPEMNLLEKIIYVSDYIEPGRTQESIPSLNDIRKAAITNIDLAVYYKAENTIRFLKEENRHIDKASMVTLNYYKKII